MNSDTAPVFDDNFLATLTGLFKWRRDVRSFLSDAVPQTTINTLFELANLAPSVGLSQPWRFVMVNDEARRQAIRDNFESCNALALKEQEPSRTQLYAKLKLSGLYEAPVQFAVCNEYEPIKGHGLGRQTMPEMTTYSTVMAIHTLWLAARSMGLGLGWVSILEPKTVIEILELPHDMQLIGYFCLGVPSLISNTPELERMGWDEHSKTINIIER